MATPAGTADTDQPPTGTADAERAEAESALVSLYLLSSYPRFNRLHLWRIGEEDFSEGSDTAYEAYEISKSD